MKKGHYLLVAVFSWIILPASADTTVSHLGSSLAHGTASLAQSTLGIAHDTAITTYIYAKLASHPNLANANLDISTTDGRVFLNGIVNDENQAREIKQLAENTMGVKSVDASNLMISQQESSIFIKARSSLPSTVSTIPEPPKKIDLPPNKDPARQMRAQHQQDSKPRAHKLLLVYPKKRLAKPKEPTIQINKQKKITSSQQPRQKHKNAWLAEHKKKQGKTKKREARLKAKKQFAHHLPPRKKIRIEAHHNSKTLKKQLAKHTLTKEKLPLPHLSQTHNKKESVDHMTSNFLKTALMANKPIPEE